MSHLAHSYYWPTAMSQLSTQIPTDTWVNVTWQGYLEVLERSEHQGAKGYYHDGRMRLEISPLGNPHSRDHAVIIGAIFLFAGLKEINLDSHDNCTYRKTGHSEAQPDVSFYLGDDAEVIPWDATIIDLDRYPAPDLVIEVAVSSLADDKGEKRLLYESLGVKEYWIIDVDNVQLLAFAVENRGSRRIEQSLVLPGLDLAILRSAFQRSRKTNHGKVSAWLLAQFTQQ